MGTRPALVSGVRQMYDLCARSSRISPIVFEHEITQAIIKCEELRADIVRRSISSALFQMHIKSIPSSLDEEAAGSRSHSDCLFVSTLTTLSHHSLGMTYHSGNYNNKIHALREVLWYSLKKEVRHRYFTQLFSDLIPIEYKCGCLQLPTWYVCYIQCALCYRSRSSAR